MTYFILQLTSIGVLENHPDYKLNKISKTALASYLHAVRKCLIFQLQSGNLMDEQFYSSEDSYSGIKNTWHGYHHHHILSQPWQTSLITLCPVNPDVASKSFPTQLCSRQAYQSFISTQVGNYYTICSDYSGWNIIIPLTGSQTELRSMTTFFL